MCSRRTATPPSRTPKEPPHREVEMRRRRDRRGGGRKGRSKRAIPGHASPWCWRWDRGILKARARLSFDARSCVSGARRPSAARAGCSRATRPRRGRGATVPPRGGSALGPLFYAYQFPCAVYGIIPGRGVLLTSSMVVAFKSAILSPGADRRRFPVLKTEELEDPVAVDPQKSRTIVAMAPNVTVRSE